MDIGRAFSSVTKDPDWVKKVLIGGLMVLIPIIGWLLLIGYGVAIVRRVYEGNDTLLPAWDDWGNRLTQGLIFFVGSLIWSLPVSILSGVSQVLVEANGDAVNTVGFFSLCLTLPISLIYSVTIPPIIQGRYAVHERFSAMFEFDEVFADIRRAGGSLILLFLVYILLSIVALLGLIAFCIGVIFTIAFASFVYSNAVGQVYRKASGGVSPSNEVTAF